MDPNIADIREKDTDWNRWLMGRQPRPFDARAYFEFRIYRDFSGGITDQWYSHGSGLAHFYLDTFIPDNTVANGGIFAWHDGRENPDTFACLSIFAEKEVLYSFSVCFGNGYGDHTIIRGVKGTLYCPGGEGSPQWWYLPETRSGWPSNAVFNLKLPGGPKPELVTIPGRTDVPPRQQGDDLAYHTDNWLASMRSRKPPTATLTRASGTRWRSSWPLAPTAKARKCTGTGRTSRSSITRLPADRSCGRPGGFQDQSFNSARRSRTGAGFRQSR